MKKIYLFVLLSFIFNICFANEITINDLRNLNQKKYNYIYNNQLELKNKKDENKKVNESNYHESKQVDKINQLKNNDEIENNNQLFISSKEIGFFELLEKITIYNFESGNVFFYICFTLEIFITVGLLFLNYSFEKGIKEDKGHNLGNAIDAFLLVIINLAFFFIILPIVSYFNFNNFSLKDDNNARQYYSFLTKEKLIDNKESSTFIINSLHNKSYFLNSIADIYKEKNVNKEINSVKINKELVGVEFNKYQEKCLIQEFGNIKISKDTSIQDMRDYIYKSHVNCLNFSVEKMLKELRD